MEKKIDRMEEMLTSLISIVGNMNQKLQIMGQEQQTMRQEQQIMHQEIQSLAQEQHLMREDLSNMKGDITDIKRVLIDMRADQDHIWEKTVKNERELAIFKKHLQV